MILGGFTTSEDATGLQRAQVEFVVGVQILDHRRALVGDPG